MGNEAKAPKQVYVSVAARILMNVEAANMAETVGNISRHRKAPVVLMQKQGGVSVVYVPAISGESLAYHYQKLLATIANERGLPVTKMDLQGFFMKFSTKDIIEEYYKDVTGKFNIIDESDVCKIEEAILMSSVVADVGGFLYTDKQVKRTSRIRFGYMVPTQDAIERGAATSYPQLHARYTPRAKKEEQVLYYVETASALYAFTAGLNVSDIAELTQSCNLSIDLASQKKKRIEVAYDALVALLDGALFGAKRSRFNPLWDVVTLAVSVSKGPVEFNLTPPHSLDYIANSVDRAGNLAKVFGNMEINIYWFSKENIKKPSQPSKNVFFEETNSHTDALVKARAKLLEYLAPGR